MKRSVRSKTTPKVETPSVFPSRCDSVSATELLIGFPLSSVNYLEKLSPSCQFCEHLCCENHTLSRGTNENFPILRSLFVPLWYNVLYKPLFKTLEHYWVQRRLVKWKPRFKWGRKWKVAVFSALYVRFG